MRICLSNGVWSDEEPSCAMLFQQQSYSHENGLPLLGWGIITGVLALSSLVLLIINIISCCKICRLQNKVTMQKPNVDWPDVTRAEVIENFRGVALSQDDLSLVTSPRTGIMQNSQPHHLSQVDSTASLLHDASQSQYVYTHATTPF